MINKDLDLYSLIAYSNASFNFVYNFYQIDHNKLGRLTNPNIFKGNDSYEDTFLLISRISEKAMYDYEKLYYSKKCIDKIVEEIFNTDKENIDKIDVSSIIESYMDSIDNLDSKYKMSRIDIIKRIGDDIAKYHNYYNKLNDKLLNNILANIDNVYRYMGSVLFDYGKMGNSFNKIYTFYYNNHIYENIDTSRQFSMIISYIKFMHRCTNYNTEEMRLICNNLKESLG